MPKSFFGITESLSALKDFRPSSRAARQSGREKASGHFGFTYHVAVHQISRTDARDFVWQTLRPNCCAT